MTVYIKNMMCIRCVMAVEQVLREQGIPFASVGIGSAELSVSLAPAEKLRLDTALRYYSLELMDKRKNILAERIKTVIIELLHSNTVPIQFKFSEFLSKKLSYDYTYLSNIFSEIQNTTIEKFYILQRIERAKELIVYDEMNVTEIAYHLNYSSVSHLCLQFKKVTGLTPAVFKKRCLSREIVWRSID